MGAAVAIAKIATTGGVHPLGYVFWVAIIAALILTAICAVRGTGRHRIHLVLHHHWRAADRKRQRDLVHYGQVRPAGALAVVLGLTPIFTYGISLAMRLETFAALRATGLSFGFVGVVMFVIPSQSLPDPSMIPWMLFDSGAVDICAGQYPDRPHAAENRQYALSYDGYGRFGAIFMLPVVFWRVRFTSRHSHHQAPTSPCSAMPLFRVSHSSRYSR